MPPGAQRRAFPVILDEAEVVAQRIEADFAIGSQQQVLGASNRELERDVAEMRRERTDLLQRLENLEAIVVSQTWDAVHDNSLPPAEKEHRVASTVRREIAPAGPNYQQRAEQLARRLQG